MRRYKVTVPGYSGIITTEMVEGKEVVIAAPKNMTWAVGKNIWEAAAYYRARPGGTVEPIGGKKKIVRRKKKLVVRIRRKK
ncbi:hypothetical protein GCM10010423_64970 [Streptomyces levis]|uniref:50S ribosomal protein L6 n=1 Tax=Streptomyces levis TaxID=285566 RepID=A0ABN3P256_9ACTN